MYKYALEKYRGPASRHTCLDCGHKREFTRYVDSVTGEYLHEKVGKCNRSSNCTYHYTPAQYFADHPELGKPSLSLPYQLAPASKPTAPPAPPGTIDRSYLVRSIGIKSDFATWLSRYFDAETIRAIVEEYGIGYTKDGRVIFWQQDIDGFVRTGQVMRYDPRTGRRTKGQPGAMDWTHAILKRRGELPEDFNLRQCLFGEHLLARYPEATVVLVESAKSAAACRALLGEFIWVATGGKAGFSVERCRSLAGRRVVIIPDLDAHEEWSAKAPQIAREVGCEMAVSDFLWRMGNPEKREAGYDIADYIIDRLDDGVPAKFLANKLSEAIGAKYIPARLSNLIAGCLKEPFKK